jgi:hypothetical protein
MNIVQNFPIHLLLVILVLVSGLLIYAFYIIHKGFEVRTIGREKLISFLQQNYTESSPIVRVELDKD